MNLSVGPWSAMEPTTVA